MKEKLQTIPKKPGCYLMKDNTGTIIYVGKAKNLYNRVRSYFVGSHDAKTTKMISCIDDFETIITSNETEAFILELNLIKKHQPKYNIMLTDDKTYPYIGLSDEVYPRLFYTRDVNKKKGNYYGPYPDAIAAKDLVEMLNKMYPLVKCRKIPKKECLYYHIGQCLAPCINPIDVSIYQTMRKKIHQIIKGNTKEEIKILEKLMDEASQNLEFEKAIEYRKIIQDLKSISERQKMDGVLLDTDAFAYYHNDVYISIQVFHMREGKMIERNGFLFEHLGQPQDVFESFIVQFYQEKQFPRPKTILMSKGNHELVQKALNQNIIIPKKGQKKELIALVEENAKDKMESLIKQQEQEIKRTSGAQEELKELLQLPRLTSIEAFDNSNIMGTSPVSAMVVYHDGIPQKQLYRKFRIKSVQGVNDAQTMFEVIQRRYKDLANNPDLIIVDGGKIQVSFALQALESCNRHIPVCGLIKDDKHRTKSIYFNNEEIAVSKHKYLFLFLEALQDEVHRYAITFFRNTHSKNTFASKLDEIKGIGKVKKNQILRLLGKPDFTLAIKKLNLTEEQIKSILKYYD